MRILQLSPGAGAMYCGNCLHDNALVTAWRKQGHQVLMVPLYLPLTLDEPDQSAGTPIFFSGINVYLEQKSAFFRQSPKWFHHLMASRRLLEWAGTRAGKTRAAELGELTLSMLQGEAGNQARELEELIAWLKTQPRFDFICLSNALLLGLGRRLKQELAAPVICMLQGEDAFLNALPEPHREQCWRALAERAAEIEHLVAPSRYFADLMRTRLELPPAKVSVVYDGINLEGYGQTQSLDSKNQSQESLAKPWSLTSSETSAQDKDCERGPGRNTSVLGYFARMCPEKGLDTLVAAFVRLSERGQVPGLKLRIGGYCGPADEPFVQKLRAQLQTAGLLGAVEFCPNLSRADKLAFFKSLTVFSVPARYGEAFGLYLLEALAMGVPVVQPRSGAFPEVLELTGGGLLCESENPTALAQSIEELLLNPRRARALGETGQRAVFERFGAEKMGREMIQLVENVTRADVAALPR